MAHDRGRLGLAWKTESSYSWWSASTRTESLFGSVMSGILNRHRVVQRLPSRQGSGAGKTGGRDIKPAGALTEQSAPVRQPPEASLEHPSPRQHDEALLAWLARHHDMAHAMPVGPCLAAFGGQRAVVDGFAQARPVCLPRIERRQGIAILQHGRHATGGQPVAIGIHQCHPFAPEPRFARIAAAWPTHRDAVDPLGVDDAQPRGRPPPRGTAPAALLASCWSAVLLNTVECRSRLG